MSVVLVVDSESQFRSGAPWSRAVCRQTSLPVRIIVLGEDRKTLTELIRRNAAQMLDVRGERIEVQSAAPDTSAILDVAQAAKCETLLIPTDSELTSWQENLFLKSPCRTCLFRVTDDLPVGDHSVISVDGQGSSVSSTEVGALLGFSSIDQAVFSADQPSPEETNHDWTVIGIDRCQASDATFQFGRTRLASPGGKNVVLVHSGDTMSENLAMRVRRWFATIAPPMDRAQRIELAKDLETNSRPNFEFLGLMSAASMLASFGLLQDSAAVIIGAMLIAPLMTPIMGAGLGLAHGNRPLFHSSLLTIVIGFFGALVASMLFGWLYWTLETPTVTPEMWARCNPSPLDFCVGLVGGMAASYARTRTHLSSALAGAAIAAALVPPIATAGLQIAFGVWGRREMGIPIAGPLLLVCVNVLTIMVGSSFILWGRGMRGETTFDSTMRWSVRMTALLIFLALMVLILILYEAPTRTDLTTLQRGHQAAETVGDG